MNRTIISRPVYCLLSSDIVEELSLSQRFFLNIMLLLKYYYSDTLSNRPIENNNVVYNIVQSDIILNVDFARSVALQSTHLNLGEATYTLVIDRGGESNVTNVNIHHDM